VSLDKAWGAIQQMLDPSAEYRPWWAESEHPARPAYEFVRGGTNGLGSYRRLLPPDVVDAAAADLDAFFVETGRQPPEPLSDEDIDDPGFLSADDLFSEGPRYRFSPEYDEQYLEMLLVFAHEVAGQGLHVYYSIG